MSVRYKDTVPLKTVILAGADDFSCHFSHEDMNPLAIYVADVCLGAGFFGLTGKQLGESVFFQRVPKYLRETAGKASQHVQIQAGVFYEQGPTNFLKRFKSLVE